MNGVVVAVACGQTSGAWFYADTRDYNYEHAARVLISDLLNEMKQCGSVQTWLVVTRLCATNQSIGRWTSE